MKWETLTHMHSLTRIMASKCKERSKWFHMKFQMDPLPLFAGGQSFDPFWRAKTSTKNEKPNNHKLKTNEKLIWKMKKKTYCWDLFELFIDLFIHFKIIQFISESFPSHFHFKIWTKKKQPIFFQIPNRFNRLIIKHMNTWHF